MENLCNYPKVSVITVCYNAAKELEETILSVSEQTYDNIEFIIIDGKSSDDTVSIIGEYKKYISSWISEPDKGIYDAMNKGIRLATGDWIVFMNAGDSFFSKDVISSVFNKSIPSNVKLIYGDVMLDFGDKGKLLKRLCNIDKEVAPFEICHQSVFTSSDFLKKNMYDTSYKICADCDNFYKIQKSGFGLQYVPITVSVFEVVKGVSSNRLVESFKERVKIKNIDRKSFYYFTGLIKVYIKYWVSLLMPAKLYNCLRFKSVKSHDIYK